MAFCPCCSGQMVRHIRHHQMNWFCQRCWQVMPNLLSQEFDLAPSCHLTPAWEKPLSNPLLTFSQSLLSILEV